MKKHHLLATLLVLVLIVSALPVTASAYYRESVSVNVDGETISDINVYLDDDNNVRVSTGDDLLKIFPKELKDIPIAYGDDGILLEDYIDDFGYESYLRVSYDNGRYFYYTLYIYTDTNNSWESYPPSTDFRYPEVYINGIYTPMSDIYQYWTIDFSKYKTPIFSGNRIYLNNDGNTPVEIVVDGKLIHFSDQQPIVFNPGRTMVPVRTVAEMLGCRVEWDQMLNCAVIMQGRTTMYIYPGNTSYLLNGKYYTMDVEPVALNGRIMVPLRFIAEEFGYTVNFQSRYVLTVYLTSQKTIKGVEFV
ncbi:MAG: hypothetical protein HFJ30_01685 [Clostridia bacterium]|jgi:hypothetical protein|nr:hypothetical protein [Clostridia bacterium]MCI9413195.1 hypothetical protein [Clostridia bacterium]